MNREEKRNFRGWLCEVEHELIMCGMSSIDATRLIENNEAKLTHKYLDGATVVSAATGLRINK